MRWKLLFITSLCAAVVGIGLWCLLAVAIYGSAMELSQQPSILFASAILPLLSTVAAATFTYRHTARRRKIQAVLSALVTLVLCVVVYYAAATILPKRFMIDRGYIPRLRK